MPTASDTSPGRCASAARVGRDRPQSAQDLRGDYRSPSETLTPLPDDPPQPLLHMPVRLSAPRREDRNSRTARSAQKVAGAAAWLHEPVRTSASWGQLSET